MVTRSRILGLSVLCKNYYNPSPFQLAVWEEAKASFSTLPSDEVSPETLTAPMCFGQMAANKHLVPYVK